ncbi:MAG: binding-protein-dependent transport system inner rane component [Polaromonas sp.]|nr:binding-protein-dependent transport system inner rane component [Polaromonas sp.]
MSVSFTVVATLFIVVMIIPVAWAVFLGFTHSGPFNANTTYAGLANYQAVLSDGAFWRALAIGIAYALTTTALEMVLGIGVALLLFRSGKPIFTSLTLLPYMVPTVTTALVWSWMTDSLYGIINHTLLQGGVVDSPIDFAGNSAWAFALVTAASVWQFTPFVILVTLSNLGTVPHSVYEASHIDGANWWQQLTRITLPIIRASILLTILLRGIWMFNRFDVIWLLTAGGPLGSTTTLPVYAYERAFGDNSYGPAGAASTVIFAILLVVGIFYMRVFQPHKEVARG